MGASPHAFTVVRGRGYRPEQVDRAMAVLIGQQEENRVRLAELAAREAELIAEAERLREVAASAPPPAYENLGRRARRLLTLAEAEAEDVRAAAGSDAARTEAEAEAEAEAVRAAAEEEAELLRTEAAAAAARRVEAARSEAEAMQAAAKEAARRTRAEAADALRDAQKQCDRELAEQERTHAARSEEAERELAERKRSVETYVGELADRGDELLKEARREREDAEEDARRWQEEAESRGEKLLAGARVRAEAVERETERVLDEHAGQAAEMRRHMARVRSTLAALTGRTGGLGGDEPEGPDRRSRDADAGRGGAEGEARGGSDPVTVPGQVRGRGR